MLRRTLPPPSNDMPGIVWTLRKQQRTLVARLASHALGLELILEMDGEVRYTAIAKSIATAQEEADGMRTTLLERGWRADGPGAT